ncbi:MULTISPECIES: hypothetical protein [Streptomyces]|uniref:hypothetical protein n=1 Tax=Streptomyces TaxID=1883 RepID=UPI00163CCACD|nr:MULTISPECIES: hypothetical protein [Streptomyces]MBC2876947.1 hypothetical protein [Streptomyces sp. TYQ1024]UBI35973.1 hypothetical protein K7I03_05510 [Streptomyces mobaraensis]UKW28566.1 hypothetical protein MCU78_05505 [Streptomyces sp. TYQ1024]
MRVLRAAAVAVLLDTLVQAALAGLFVTGDLDLLAWHAANAGVLSALTVVETVAALVVWRWLRAPGWPAAVSAGLVVLVGVQRGLGEARALAGHMPLGMAVFGCSTALAYWAFSHRVTPAVTVTEVAG